MFNHHKWKPFYDIYTNNIAQEFYVPAMKDAKIVKRVSAYFSSKALAYYSTGLEALQSNKAKYYLIISQNINESDFNEIKKGYTIKNEIINNMVNHLEDVLNEDEIQKLSNLSYYIAIGVIEIKIAFVKQGIFHDKFAIFKDFDGNEMCMRGSNNETESALIHNFESFELTCKWLSSEFDAKKIDIQNNKFDMMWNNNFPNMVVLNAPEIILNKIASYNKGKIIPDKLYLEENTIIFDLLNNRCVIYIGNIDINTLAFKKYYKIYLKKYIASISEPYLFIKKGDSPVYINNCFNDFKKQCLNIPYNVVMTSNLSNYLKEKNIHIEKRINLGISIKNKDNIILPAFNEYKKLVDNLLQRKLRQKQMWDSFFMYSMKRSSNFSVPGSGKTSSVYGVFAALNHFNKVNKLVMIGPKNSFLSWEDEFINCFGNNLTLKVLDIQSNDYLTIKQKKYAIEYNANQCNLILINYEITPQLEKELSSLVSNNTLLVFDEVHKIKKAEDGVRSTACLNIAKYSNYVITMTGTPIPNGYIDIYNNFNILFPYDYNEYFDFSISYLKNPSTYDIKQINNKIFPFFCRTNKKELHVPEANKDIIVTCNATNNEFEIFNIIKNKCRKNPLELLIRILQLESNPKMLLKSINVEDFENILINSSNDNLKFVDFSNELEVYINKIDETSKKRKTINLIQKLHREGKSVIVWCIFNDSILLLFNSLKRLGIKCKYINGSISNNERESIMNAFKNKEFNILITNPHTLAESVSLHHVCHDAIYYEYSYNLVHLLQSKDRIHRLGLPEKQYTQYYYMNTLFQDGTNFDQRIYERLKEKEENMLESIDNNILEGVYTTQEDINFILNDLL